MPSDAYGDADERPRDCSGYDAVGSPPEPGVRVRAHPPNTIGEGASVAELLSELKDACQRVPGASDEEVIARGGSTWFRGLPANAEQGTVALGLGQDARVVISERDIRSVTKDDDHYNVEVGSEANVLLRIEKSLKATVHADCGCNEHTSSHQRRRRRGRDIDLEIGPVTVCPVLCADIVVDNGKQSVGYRICVPVLCEPEPQSSR